MLRRNRRPPVNPNIDVGINFGMYRRTGCLTLAVILLLAVAAGLLIYGLVLTDADQGTPPARDTRRPIPPLSEGAITRNTAAAMTELRILGRGRVGRLDWSPDGRTLAAAGSLGVWLYDAGDWQAEPRRLVGHVGPVEDVRFSRDGQLLASAGAEGTAVVWEVSSGARRLLVGGHEGRLTGVDFGADDALLVTAGEDGRVLLWEVASGRLLAELAGLSGAPRAIAFSPDGRYLAAADGQMVLLWDVSGRGSTVQNLTDDQLSGDALVQHIIQQIKDTGGLPIARRIAAHTSPLTALAFSPDGSLLATGAIDRSLRVWNTDDFSQRAIWQNLAAPPSAIAFGAANQHVMWGDRASGLRVWNMNPSLAPDTLSGHSGQISGVAASPDGAHLASSSLDATIRVWPLGTTGAAGPPAIIDDHTGPVNDLAFHPNSRLLAAAKGDTLQVWEVGAARSVARRQHTAEIRALAWAGDGRLLAAGGADGSILLWEIGHEMAEATGDRIGDEMGDGGATGLLRGHSAAVTGLAFSPDGRLLASCGMDGSVRVWDISPTAIGGTARARLAEGAGVWNGLDFAPDGTRVAAANAAGYVTIWDAIGENQVGYLNAHAGAAWDVSFDPAGELVASGGADSNLRMWRVASSVPVGGGQENEGDVWAVDWSPRGSLVASGGADTTVRVWNDRGLPLKRLNGHTEAVRVVAFSPDGALLASAGLDGSVRVWGLR